MLETYKWDGWMGGWDWMEISVGTDSKSGANKSLYLTLFLKHCIVRVQCSKVNLVTVVNSVKLANLMKLVNLEKLVSLVTVVILSACCDIATYGLV